MCCWHDLLLAITKILSTHMEVVSILLLKVLTRKEEGGFPTVIKRPGTIVCGRLCAATNGAVNCKKANVSSTRVTGKLCSKKWDEWHHGKPEWVLDGAKVYENKELLCLESGQATASWVQLRQTVPNYSHKLPQRHDLVISHTSLETR